MKRFVFALAILVSPAMAQQLSPQQQAAANLGQQIGLLAANNAELAAQIQALNAQLVEKDKRIKALEDVQQKADPPK
jgi:Tfp pilus assembly protein PilN